MATYHTRAIQVSSEHHHGGLCGVLGPLVQQITAAHARHGGEGAYYVYLRRRRT